MEMHNNFHHVIMHFHVTINILTTITASKLIIN